MLEIGYTVNSLGMVSKFRPMEPSLLVIGKMGVITVRDKSRGRMEGSLMESMSMAKR